MANKVIYHKDPLGLMSGKIPQDYLRLVQSLIRPDDEEPSPVQQMPLPIIPVQSTQPSGHRPSDICVFCQKAKHKFPLFCRKLQRMKATHILDIMQHHGIQCEMCLDINHPTAKCKLIKNGKLKKCHIKMNGIKCNQYHCKYLHRY